MNGSCGCTAEMAANGTRPCDIEARKVITSLFSSRLADPMLSFLNGGEEGDGGKGGPGGDGEGILMIALRSGFVMAVSEPAPTPEPSPDDPELDEDAVEEEIEELIGEGREDGDEDAVPPDAIGTETMGLYVPASWKPSQERELVPA